MSIREAMRLSVMEQIDKKVLSIDQASRELDLSLRQIKRIRKRYKLEGKQGIISKRRGVPNIRRIPAETRKRAVRLLDDPMCKDWGPTFAQEKLSAMHGITVSVETLRKWMIEEGLWKNKVKKQIRIHQRRKRRSHFGELIQGDGSHHAWFESRTFATLDLRVDPGLALK
ncbi:MAG: hypothetical protein K1000chlam3_01582 [Chlamydiae bacterium]|nr:hypothetical protein [Chlamydiota bacterium]